MFCKNCGKEISDQSTFCENCGTPVNIVNDIVDNSSPKNWLLALLLSIFFGSLGIHRFYVGKIGTGILMLITLGGCGIWTLIDIIIIICGNFTDNDGKVLQNR